MHEYPDLNVSCVFRKAKGDFCMTVEVTPSEGVVTRKRFYNSDLQALLHQLWIYYLQIWRLVNGDDPPPTPKEYEARFTQMPLWW